MNDSQPHQHYQEAQDRAAHQASAPSKSKSKDEGKVHFLIQNGIAGEKLSGSKPGKYKQKKSLNTGLK